MDRSIKQIESHEKFVAFWNRLLKILILWLGICPALLIIAYEVYHWLRFAEFLDLVTYEIAPPRLVGFLYNLTNWEGANMLIFKFLQLPIFITMPIISSIIIFSFFQSVLALYYMALDSVKLIRKITSRLI